MKRLALICLIFFALVLLVSPAFAAKSAYDWALIKLDHVRQEKVSELRHFTDRLHALARGAAEDAQVVQFFDMNLKLHDVSDPRAVSASLNEKVGRLRKNFDQYYIEEYFAFHDLLFVDLKGDVFYSIRKEADLNSNLFEAAAEGNGLGMCLASRPVGEAFVDFQQYAPSAGAAAFFVEPIQKDNVQLGWLVLQCAARKVNSLFTSSEEIGETGETFLVNDAGFMLTESYFEGASTVLTKRLDDRKIQAKFTDGMGHRTVIDYRGVAALSSFEVFPFMGTRWLVVAKMDRDEVVTDHYRDHRSYYAQRLLDIHADSPLPAADTAVHGVEKTVLRVDMDEFLKAGEGESLETFGVSTCTALIATYPGKFAYLGHLSPRDRIYGASATNLLGQMTKKIESFDIYPCERRKVQFVLVAPHRDTLLNVVDRLVDDGFLLSQIRVIINVDAESASIAYDHTEDQLTVHWRGEDHSETGSAHRLSHAWNVGEAMEQLMKTEMEPDVQSTEVRS